MPRNSSQLMRQKMSETKMPLLSLKLYREGGDLLPANTAVMSFMTIAWFSQVEYSTRLKVEQGHPFATETWLSYHTFDGQQLHSDYIVHQSWLIYR